MITLAQALLRVRRLGLDTAPIIYFIEAHPTYDERVSAVFERIDSGSLIGFTSVISLTEVLVKPLRSGDALLHAEYVELLEATATVVSVPVSSEIALRAAQLRARYGIRTPDALQIATALEHGCDAFLTNDRQLSRISELAVLVLDDLTL